MKVNVRLRYIAEHIPSRSANDAPGQPVPNGWRAIRREIVQTSCGAMHQMLTSTDAPSWNR